MRGTPVPVVDAGLLVGQASTQSGRLISLKVGDRRIALAVDAVLGIRRFDTDTFRQLPPLLRDVAGETLAAVGARDAELMFTLRAARIVPGDLQESDVEVRIVPESVFDQLERDGGDV